MKIGKNKIERLADYIRTDCPDGLCWTIRRLFPYLCGRDLPEGASFIKRYESRQTRARSYRTFTIPKKSGGERVIQAPERDLKDIQRCLLFILSQLWSPRECVHGFTAGRSVVSGATEHVGHNYIFNADIRDFFPTINLKRVRSSLKRMGIPPETAAFIAELTTVPSSAGPCGAIPADDCVLAQGAPTSPILSNIVCDIMDRRLMGLANRFGLKYTRYADDMTFSSLHNVYRDGSEFRKELQKVMCDNGFVLNPDKTRLMKRGARQEVTGLTVSTKLNVSRKWIKTLRAEIHRYEKGPAEEFTPAANRHLNGKLNWAWMVRGKGHLDQTYVSLRNRLRFLQITRL